MILHITQIFYKVNVFFKSRMIQRLLNLVTLGVLDFCEMRNGIAFFSVLLESFYADTTPIFF
jgi:hypothetical protein